MSRLPLALAVLLLAGLPACSAGDSEGFREALARYQFTVGR